MTAPSPRIDLSGNRAALLQALLKKKARPGGGIALRPDRDFAPVSVGQEQMWWLHQLDPAGTAYHIITPFRLRGELDAEELDRHLRTIRRRHEILRTVFVEIDGRVTQKIQRPNEQVPVLDVFDLRGVDLDGAAAQELLLQHAEAPFDLARGPLFRAALVRVGAREHLGHVTLHHIVSDGWSSGVLFRELSMLLSGAAALPDLPLQFGDFAAWQRESLAAGRWDDQLAFWRDALADAPALLNLPIDRPRGRSEGAAGGLETGVLPQEIVRRLAAIGEQEGATLFMTLLAGYVALLTRYTGQNDIVVGTPIANRNRMELEPLIGLFLNVLPIRTKADSQPTFRQLVGRVRDAARAAYANPDAPFGKLVEMLRPDRSAGHSPLVQAMFVMQNTPNRTGHTGDWELEPITIPRRSAKNDLTLYAEEGASGLSLAFEYHAGLFESATVRQMLCGLDRLLRAAAEMPELRLSDLPALSDTDRNRVVYECNATEVQYGPCAIQDLVSAQTGRTPDATAIRFRGVTLTYRELDSRSNRLAHFLRNRGAGRDVLAAICMDRSLDMLVSMLGVLKAGAAYVPLDPAYPADRIGMALDDSQARLLLTHSSIRGRMPATAAEVVEIDRAMLDAFPGEAPAVAVGPGDLAYVIFTSGSTGRPKGVQVTHGGVVNFLRTMSVEPGLASEDVLTAVTTLSFDIAGLELFLPLTVGARIELMSHDEARDGIRLAARLEECAATCVQATPATWRMLIEAGWQGREGLKVLCGGEALPADLASALLTRCSELWNVYGPTETTIWSTVRRVSEGFEPPISIGHPIANTECYILDANLEPAPAGVPGELYIGGDGVARGYLNRPELTAEKFIPDPFRRSGARLYRTGDLARRLQDGSIECLGRADHQVKIRGFRVELGEIEESLQLHPGVARAAVIAADLHGGQKELIAYVLPAAPVEDAEMTVFLRTRLPEYMLPAVYVRLTALPLTPNGKVDRRALPAPDVAALHRERAFAPPETETERRLAAIFADVLGLDRIGRDDNFFDLGGHSLLITRLLIRIRAEFRRELPVTDIFQSPTVAMVARKLDGIDGVPAEIDFEREAVLDPAIRPNWTAAVEHSGPVRVLLTGATGFLGMFLLRALLETSDAEVVCLVRAEDDAQARRRLERNLTDAGLWKPEYASRVAALAADLARPRLGLSETMFETLGASVGAIYHNGAVVNFSQPYAMLRAANVEGTAEVLRLACHGRRKTVHYVSTISVLSGDESGQPLTEDAPLPDPPRRAGGYPQSKWVAERLLEAARDRGVPVRIYRPGTITGDSITGVCNPDDFLYRFLRGCLAMGSAPEIEMEVDLLPVDYISGAIVRLAARGEEPATYHLAGTQRTDIRDVYAWIQSFGAALAVEPYGVWRQKMAAGAVSNDDPLAPLAGFFPELPEGEAMRVPALPVQSSLTQAALREASVVCPPPDERLMHVYLKRLTGRGSPLSR